MSDIAAIVVGSDRIGPRVALTAAFLACAGIPLYIHLPRFAAEAGVPLATVGVLLLGLRILDFAQDPALGWLVDRAGDRRSRLAALSLAVLGAGFAIVFALQPALPGLVAGLVLVFTAYSLGTILLYSQGVALAGLEGGAAHYRLAGWREAGTLTGIIAAAILPEIVAQSHGPRAGYVALGIAVPLMVPLAWWGFRGLFAVPGAPRTPFDPRRFIAAGAGRLLLLALLNALPVAVTSTLFLFFVEDRLGLPGLAGLYLVLFFVSAGLAAPVWSRLAARFGARRVLLPAMGLAVLAFAGAAMLPEGAAFAFAAITLASGVALGADMVILPALFSATLARSRLPAAMGFGAWAFAAKLALALAAGTVLPVLHLAGFVPGGPNDASALDTLNFTYAVLPLFLKLPAIVMVARLPEEAL